MNEIEQVKNEVVKFDSSAVITITDNESYIAGGERRKAAARFIKAAHEKFDSDISVAHNHHKSLVAKLREIIAPVGTWMKKVDRQLLDYTTEQENIRLEAEAKAREQARKIEEERKLAEAIELEAQGDKKESEQVMSEPVYVPPVVIASTVPKLKGISYPVRWKPRIIDERKIPREYLMVNMEKIRGIVTAMKADTNIPGIEAYSVKGTSGRA